MHAGYFRLEDWHCGNPEFELLTVWSFANLPLDALHQTDRLGYIPATVTDS